VMGTFLTKTNGNTWGNITKNFVSAQFLRHLDSLHEFHIGRHEAYYRSKCGQTTRDPASGAEFSFLPDELVNIEVSHKVFQLECNDCILMS
jgi:uncharacterized SAM-dependent methyltransferase